MNEPNDPLADAAEAIAHRRTYYWFVATVCVAWPIVIYLCYRSIR